MNRNLIPVKTSIFRNKLSKILERLHQDRDKIPLQTQEAIVAEAVKLLSAFYKTIAEPGFNPTPVVAGTKPDADDYNSNLLTLKDDIDILFSELENLESIVLEHFNLLATQANRLNSRVKRVASSIVDYELFTRLPIKNSLFITDSFTDTSKIELNSKLLNSNQCEIDTPEGIVKLPIDGANSKNINITIKPFINSNSNGRVGNNEEIGARLNGEVSVVTDNNPDTWFEYERVVVEDDGVPLVLDLTLNLDTEQVINFIRVNPNNFGTKTEIEIQEIATSLDGLTYKSIKDEFKIPGLLITDEQNIFNLAPATSKFAGQGLFSFTPRFAKYVRLVLRQLSPYLINTVHGSQLRYAIGLRDIEVDGLAYLNSGELVSNVFSIDSEIKKVALRTSQSPAQVSDLGSITHQISLDDGNSWIKIEPLEQDGSLNISNAREVLNINTEDIGSISTPSPVKSLRYKALLKREDTGFTSSSTAFAEEIQPITELKSIPLVEPWVFTLDQNPIVDSVAVIDPNFGSRGNFQYKYLLAQATGNNMGFVLPWDNLRLDKVKEKISDIWQVSFRDLFTVYVAGERWTQIPDLSTAGESDKVYQITTGSRLLNSHIGLPAKGPIFTEIHLVNSSIELKFGDGFNGLSPPVGSAIEILFTDERLFPVSKQVHKSGILFPTGIDKSAVSIYRKGFVLSHNQQLKPGLNIHNLSHRNIVLDSDHPIRFTSSIFTNRKIYKNGLAAPEGELETSGDYSVDTERGIVYSYDRTGTSGGTVTYSYQDQVELNETQWDWGDDLPTHRSVIIKDSGWVPNKITSVAVPEGVKKINLEHLSILEGSVQFTGIDSFSSSENPFIKEVPFIDGVSELSTVIKTSDKVPTLEPVSNVASFVTNLPIISSTELAVSFSNADIFVTAVGTLGAVNSVGKYFVDRSIGTIYVHTDGVTLTDTGDYSYYVSDPSKVVTGSYSIDYENGEIYLQREVPAASNVKVSYQYSEYYMRYNIARNVRSDHFSVDPSTKRVTILPPEVQLRSRVQNVAGQNTFKPAAYQVNYKYIASIRKNIEQLKPFFTPILKDYTLQIVTDDFL